MTQAQLARAIRESHRRQYAGEDYQVVAFDLLQGVEPPATDFELAQVESGPEEGCECGFCNSVEARWEHQHHFGPVGRETGGAFRLPGEQRGCQFPFGDVFTESPICGPGQPHTERSSS